MGERETAPLVFGSEKGYTEQVKKILIVDDQSATLRMTDHILKSQYKTFCASSGEEALSVCEKENPDMILTDLHLPDIAGPDLLSAVCGKTEHRIPVLFMTEDADECAELKGHESGASEFIRKPFRADLLLQRIDRILKDAERIEDLRRAAATDPVTGLYNKTSSRIEIGKLVKDIPGVLLLADLDHLKMVNELCGEDMGDKLLIRFSEIIRSAVRQTDILGRFGGDVFIAFCRYISDENVIAEKTEYINEEMQKAAKELLGEDVDIPLGVSVGAVLAPDDGIVFEELYKKADATLYEVKKNGGHGSALFRDKKKKPWDAGVASTGIENEMRLLRERNRGAGAYSLSYEEFRMMYRFFVRLETNYHKHNHLLMFTLRDPDTDASEISRIMDRFLDVTCASLRASDVVARKGTSQVLILIFETNHADTKMVINRIISRWKESGENMIPAYEIGIIEDKQA